MEFVTITSIKLIWIIGLLSISVAANAVFFSWSWACGNRNNYLSTENLKLTKENKYLRKELTKYKKIDIKV